MLLHFIAHTCHGATCYSKVAPESGGRGETMTTDGVRSATEGVCHTCSRCPSYQDTCRQGHLVLPPASFLLRVLSKQGFSAPSWARGQGHSLSGGAALCLMGCWAASRVSTHLMPSSCDHSKCLSHCLMSCGGGQEPALKEPPLHSRVSFSYQDLHY